MAAQYLDGKKIAEILRNSVKLRTEQFKKVYHRSPSLAVVLVGEDPASQIYVKNKILSAEKVGIHSLEYCLGKNSSERDVIEKVKELNKNPQIDGVLVQLPLPNHINPYAVIDTIDPEKDVDGLTQINQGKLMLGEEGLRPCTPQGCIILAEKALQDLTGYKVLIIGRSILVGKPLAMLFLEKNATPTLAHSKTKHLKTLAKQADILVAAIGKPKFVKADWIKPGACVIDVGINRIEQAGKSKLIGDIDFKPVREIAGFITPVPGGVGPMTIACLLKNTIQAAYDRLQKDLL